MPSPFLLRRVYKPLLFVGCALPFAWLVWRAFGIGGASLGADPVAELLHQLGLRGLQLLLLTLLITPLRQVLHQPWLIVFRRMLGLFAFFYVLMHFLTWLVLDQGLDWSRLLPEIAKRPYITLGVLGLLLLIPLAVTSTNGMMRRLGRRWQKLHRLVYVIAVLGVWHFYWQVKKDVREPLVYCAILAVLLGWRVWHNRMKVSRSQPTPRRVEQPTLKF